MIRVPSQVAGQIPRRRLSTVFVGYTTAALASAVVWAGLILGLRTIL